MFEKRKKPKYNPDSSINDFAGEHKVETTTSPATRAIDLHQSLYQRWQSIYFLFQQIFQTDLSMANRLIVLNNLLTDMLHRHQASPDFMTCTDLAASPIKLTQYLLRDHSVGTEQKRLLLTWDAIYPQYQMLLRNFPGILWILEDMDLMLHYTPEGYNTLCAQISAMEKKLQTSVTSAASASIPSVIQPETKSDVSDDCSSTATIQSLIGPSQVSSPSSPILMSKAEQDFLEAKRIEAAKVQQDRYKARQKRVAALLFEDIISPETSFPVTDAMDQGTKLDFLVDDNAPQSGLLGRSSPNNSCS